MAQIERRFAGHPTVFVHERPDHESSKVDQLLWGDYVGVTGPRRQGWLPVKIRNQRTGWIREGDTQPNRLLEVVFVDIGQGDGCLVITPDDRFVVVDAGEGDNMGRFLRWRFRDKAPIAFDCAIMSHSDMDHYGGFEGLFGAENFTFKTVYTNGFMERFGDSDDDTLGPRLKDGKQSFIDALVTDLPGLQEFLADEALYVRTAANGRRTSKKYPTMLKTALANGKFEAFRMLAVGDRFVPGFEEDTELSLQVLGPVVESGAGGRKRLRWLGSVGKTKNGHSIVVKLKYGNLSMLLGGDLNIPSEHLLLSHHTGLKAPAATEAEREALIAKARQVFAVDIAKACHHGSADVSRDFLAALNPLVTIVSSGDAEPHSHPRPDALGAIGKNSRDARPLIFSTELARSAPERIKHPSLLRQQLSALLRAAGQATTPKKKAALKKSADKLAAQLNRSVAVYGAINVRSDGTRAVVAQMLEQRGPGGKKWDVYPLTPDASGTLRFVSKHEEE